MQIYHYAKTNREDRSKIFFNNLKKAHGDRFDTSKACYVDNKTPIILICKKHGEFQVRPAGILGKGSVNKSRICCPGCAKEKMLKNINSRRVSIKEIKKAIKKLNDKRYKCDYSSYINTQIPIRFICKKHGEFYQDLYHFKSGTRCPGCGIEKRAGEQKSTTAEFIKKAKAVHGVKYNYKYVKYENTDKKVCIVCPIHGKFWQTPHRHLDTKVGCYKCAQLSYYNSQHRSMTIEEFIKKAEAVHGDKYSYSKSIYPKNNKCKIEIICKEHGSFWQRVNTHLTGGGCPMCSMSKGEKLLKELLEKMNIEFVPQYSIPESDNTFRYDFYIPSIRTLIEYDGIQHFMKIGNGEHYDIYDYHKTIARDKAKTELANKYNYKLIRLTYRDYNRLEKIFRIRLGELYNYYDSMNQTFYKDADDIIKRLHIHYKDIFYYNNYLINPDQYENKNKIICVNDKYYIV